MAGRPFIVAHILRHFLGGAAGALAVGAGILIFDVGRLRTLMLSSDQGWIAVGLLFLGLMVTFCGAAMAAGVMALGPWRDDLDVPRHKPDQS